MKELKKRIKGLSAILLAVFMVMGMSGVRVSAEGTQIQVGNSHKKIIECVNLEFSEKGDGLNKNSSGGNFALADGNLDMFKGYMIFTEGGTASDGSTKYYTRVEVANNTFPSAYKAIKISKSEPVTTNDGTSVEVRGEDKLYRLTFAWVPNTTISIGQTVSLTARTKYSFPSGSNTHKVQGDPTNYYTTDFYVSSSGIYTILQ